MRGSIQRIVEYVHRRRWLEALAIASLSSVVFSVLMKLSLVLLFGNGIAVCWPMVGLTVSVMLRLPRRRWPWVIAVVFLGHLYVERIFITTKMIADTMCDMAETVIVAFALPPFTNLSGWMKERLLLPRFVAFAAVLGPICTSVPIGIVFSQNLHEGSFLKEALQWWFADALGNVLWLPLGMVLLSRETYDLLRWRQLPRTAWVVGLATVVSLGVFWHKPLPVSFMVMPVLLLVAVKLGFGASVVGVNLLAILGAVSTIHGTGPFAFVPPEYQIVVLQAYLALSMLSCFPVSIMMMERDTFERELREACDGMEQLATKDGLTGLANRRRFDRTLSVEWSRAIRERREIGLLMIDVDCFKMFNDCYGHPAGDLCLQSIAKALLGEAYRATDLVGRYGGEEFFVLMPGTDLSGVLMVGERIRGAVEAIGLKHERNPHRVVTISVGCCSMVPQAKGSSGTLVEAADKALYAAKAGGRNRVEAYQEIAADEARIILAGSA